MDKDFFVLEYQQSTGQFHYNNIVDGRPYDELSTHGWEPVAVTTFWKAGLFSEVASVKNYKLMKAKKHPLTLDEVKAEWRYFIYFFNNIIWDAKNGFDKYGIYVDALKDFDSQRAMADIGDPHMPEYLATENLSGDILDYDPTSAFGSNFYK